MFYHRSAPGETDAWNFIQLWHPNVGEQIADPTFGQGVFAR